MNGWSPSAKSFFARPQVARVAAPAATLTLPMELPPRCPPKTNPQPTRIASVMGVEQKMGQITNEIRAAISAVRPDDIARRWRGFLCVRYADGHRAKRISNDFEVAPQTAERWLADDGPAPSAANIARASLLFGMDAVRGVLVPDGAPQPVNLSDLSAKLDQLATMIADMRREATCRPS